MLFLVFGGLKEKRRNLFVTFFLRYRSKIGVLVSRLTLPGERRFEIFLGPGAFVSVFLADFLRQRRIKG